MKVTKSPKGELNNSNWATKFTYSRTYNNYMFCLTYPEPGGYGPDNEDGEMFDDNPPNN